MGVWLGLSFPKSLDVSKAIDRGTIVGDVPRFAAALAEAVAASGMTFTEIDKRLGVKAPGASSCYWVRTDHRGGLPARHHWEALRDLLGLPDGLVRLYDSAEREVVGRRTRSGEAPQPMWKDGEGAEWDVTAPATDDAARWQGWGTALKPAYEPIVVARKPLSGTVAANVLAHGTGAINVDATRVETVGERTLIEMDRRGGTSQTYDGGARGAFHGSRAAGVTSEGRWPANLVLVHSDGCRLVGTKRVRTSDPRRADGTVNAEFGNNGIYGTASGGRVSKPFYCDDDGREEVDEWECVEGCPVRTLDLQSGALPGGTPRRAEHGKTGTGASFVLGGAHNGFGDQGGGAARFFYTAKSSRSEREAGLLGKVPCARCGELDTTEHDVVEGEGRSVSCIRNPHPTVKPVDVMRWLVRLVTPTDAQTLDGQPGVVLDPFCGSGTTGVAAVLEGFRFVGIDQDDDYVAVARARIGWWAERGENAIEELRQQEQAEAAALRRREQAVEAGQLDLFAAAE